MSKIILFEKIEKKLFNNSLENLVLFGEENFISDKKRVYDLIFHSKQTSPYGIEKPCSLVIPVIRTFNEDEAISKIYHLNLEYPDFTKFVVPGEHIDFYKVTQKKLGKEIERLGKYFVVTEKKFLDFFGNIKLRREIQKKRRIIDNKY